jgi:O-antigen/teichoic acid export membrane protein
MDVLPWIFLGQSFIYIASPFKQYLNAKEKFTPYGIISFTSNLIKIIAALTFILYASFSVWKVVYILLGCAMFEFLSISAYVLLKTDFHFSFKFSLYQKLIKESIPLYIAALFDTSLARMDWILLGILSTKPITADYSFAYRAYDIAKLPIFILGPVILPKFIRMFSSLGGVNEQKKKEINNLFAIETFLAVAIVMFLNILWTTAIGYITKGKYGATNSHVFLIITLCLPLHFLINLLWTITYSEKKFKQISVITIVTAISNILLNLTLIPLWGGIGAALAYLISTIIQAIGYYYIVCKSAFHIAFAPIIIMPLTGISVYLLSVYLSHFILLQAFISLSLFIIASVLLKQINSDHLRTIRLYLKR